MMFRVTHVDPKHHRRKAWVTARNLDDCIAQVELELGDYLGLSVVHTKTRPVLHLVTPAPVCWPPVGVRRA